MCGIVGAIAQRNVSQILLEGLSRLEYRGYDSAGICCINNQELRCIKTTGKVKNLKATAEQRVLLLKPVLTRAVVLWHHFLFKTAHLKQVTLSLRAQRLAVFV